MSKPFSKSGAKAPPTAAEIAGWFKDWNGTKGRKMPTTQQCESIAAFLQLPSFGPNICIPQKSEIVRQKCRNAVDDVIRASKLLHSEIRRLENLVADLSGGARRLPDDIEALRKNLSSMLGKRDRTRPASRPKTPDDLGFREDLAEMCASALKEAGWRSNASRSSDNGPAVFVVARILEHLGEENVSTKTLARRLRRQN
jgi:hypothetical protein